MQSGPGRVWDRAQTNPAYALSVLLCRHGNQGLEFRASADYAGFLTAPVGLIHLDDAIQPVAARANHGATQLMQHRPGGLVTAQTEDALQTQSADAVLLAGNLPHGAEPDRQGQVTVLKNGPCRDRHLIPAVVAATPIPPDRQSISTRAPGTNPPVRPTQEPRKYSAQASSVLKRLSNSSKVLGKSSSMTPNTTGWGQWRQVNIPNRK